MIPEDDSTRLKTLKALSRVCHRFHALFHPLLFHSLNTHGSFPIRLFSELISSRPVLAGYVKRLSLEGNHTLYYYDDYTTKFKEIDPQIHVTAVGLELGTPKECVGAIMHRTPSELVDLLLACQCPNVEEIETTDPRFLLYTVLEPVARGGSFGKVHRFERLRTLNITVDVLRTYPFINLTVAFRIPTLETLVLRNAALSSEEELNWAADIEEWKSLAGSSPIRNLILKNCGLHCNEIVEAIRACRILRRFDCDFLYIIHKQLGGEAFYPTVLTALMDHRDTLEDLRISETGACNGFRPYMPYEFFSFNECRALKYLHLPLYAIAPPDGSIVVKHPSSPNTHVPKTDYVMIDDVLPPSLRVLNIDMVASREGSSDRFFLSIAELDPGPSVYFTHLKRINVTCRLESQRLSPLLPLHPCHLKRMFASQGIEFLFDVEIVPCLFTSGKCVVLCALLVPCLSIHGRELSH